MRGIKFIVDEKGRKKSVVIDLSVLGRNAEDFIDLIIAKSRENEETVPFDEAIKMIEEKEKKQARKRDSKVA